MGTRIGRLRRWLGVVALMAVAALASGCAATSIISFAYERSNEGQCISPGCAAGAMLSYALDKATEGDPTPCRKLNSVERALSPRCGPYEPGNLLTKDVTASGLPECPLTLAARDPQFWPLLDELIAKGASPERCSVAPLAALAQADACPDFTGASTPSLSALRWLAEADARSVDHDVVRMLSCPSAREVGLDKVLDHWLAQGQLPARGLPFGVLGALHPSALDTPLAHALEAQGHTARASLGAYAGALPSGFEVALREGNLAALDWWLDRVPELANRVPPRQGNQLPWVPLARVITPSYLAHPEQEGRLVSYLLSRGADPWRPMPYDANQNVLSYAWRINSSSVPLLDQPQAPQRAFASPVRAAAVSAGAGGVAIAGR